jgi:hypothetical protein
MWNRWSEFEDQTVGADLFPAFDGYIEFTKNNPQAPDGIFFGDHEAGRNIGYPTFELQSDEVTNEVKISSSCSGTAGLRACSGSLPRVKLYVDDQWSDQPTVFLHDGENEIGVGYYSIVNGREEWVGFDWITINYNEVTPTPTPQAPPTLISKPLTKYCEGECYAAATVTTHKGDQIILNYSGACDPEHVSSLKFEITYYVGNPYAGGNPVSQEKIINSPQVGDKVTFTGIDVNKDSDFVHILAWETCEIPGCRWCKNPVLDTYVHQYS